MSRHVASRFFHTYNSSRGHFVFREKMVLSAYDRIGLFFWHVMLVVESSFSVSLFLPYPFRLPVPPSKQSLVDVQRNPANADEVRLLYHRVVAPAKGVLAWAGGDTVAFDFVFTGVESMAETEVLDLGKASTPNGWKVKAWRAYAFSACFHCRRKH